MTAPVRTIFLDIDGVLNREIMGEPELDPALLALLAQLIARTNAVIVLSSSWRYDHTPAEMESILTEAGCKCSVMGATPTALEDVNVPYGQIRQRGHEITTWLEEHPGLVAAYIVLDDMDDMPGVRHRLVRTDNKIGLTQDLVEQAVSLMLG